MTDRPIIFSAAMVQALLAGRKTQTRRLASSPLARCAAGDRLYVREAISCGGVFSDVVEVRYRASESAGYTQSVEQIPLDRAAQAEKLPAWPKYRPSIHMPRWASRLTLIVEDVRYQPLHAITLSEICAEGLASSIYDFKPVQRGFAAWQSLWDSLHDEPGERWEDNPDVVALTFRVERENIDQLLARASHDRVAA